eukprot:m.179859 g.179859  ORF g.179859 m.179859 type:complete len:52 (-) comp21452_c0_seq5:89-244(-)
MADSMQVMANLQNASEAEPTLEIKGDIIATAKVRATVCCFFDSSFLFLLLF